MDLQSIPRLVDTRTATKIVPLSVSQLNKLRGCGGGPAFIKVGKRVFYEVSSLEAWIAQHRHSSTSEYGRTA
jgi:hypothetical protein